MEESLNRSCRFFFPLADNPNMNCSNDHLRGHTFPEWMNYYHLVCMVRREQQGLAYAFHLFFYQLMRNKTIRHKMFRGHILPATICGIPTNLLPILMVKVPWTRSP